MTDALTHMQLPPSREEVANSLNFVLTGLEKLRVRLAALEHKPTKDIPSLNYLVSTDEGAE
jgi:hypothetical protein